MGLLVIISAEISIPFHKILADQFDNNEMLMLSRTAIKGLRGNRKLKKTWVIPDYVIEFVIACPVFTGSVAIARKSGCLEILA